METDGKVILSEPKKLGAPSILLYIDLKEYLEHNNYELDDYGVIDVLAQLIRKYAQ